MEREKATPSTEAALEALRKVFEGTDTATQRARLREAFLQCVALTTLQIRRGLDILHPAGRVRELRDEGMRIDTLRKGEATEAGVLHSVGLYIYRRDGEPEDGS